MPGTANSPHFERHQYPLLLGACFTGHEGSGFAECSGLARGAAGGCDVCSQGRCSFVWIRPVQII